VASMVAPGFEDAVGVVALDGLVRMKSWRYRVETSDAQRRSRDNCNRDYRDSDSIDDFLRHRISDRARQAQTLSAISPIYLIGAGLWQRRPPHQTWSTVDDALESLRDAGLLSGSRTASRSR